MAILATHPGTCTANDDPIRVGDPIVPDRAGGYSHTRCAGIDDEPDNDGRWPQPRTKPRRGRRGR